MLVTKNALAALDGWPKSLAIETMEPQQLDRIAGPDAVHQGMILFCTPLPPAALEPVIEDAPGAPLLLLDQVTDPHNVGAIMRSAAAFGAAAIITQDRHSPPESAALAKAASGALEILPWVQVVNLARALEQLAQAGYWRIGLDGTADTTLGHALANSGPACLVLGAEGRGLRPNVASHCDQIAKLPIDAKVESLNVSNAAAVALYALRNRSH
ncbi:MAG: hypothetical protein Tsb0016_20460 [Sphingomonadales bacterium]